MADELLALVPADFNERLQAMADDIRRLKAAKTRRGGKAPIPDTFADVVWFKISSSASGGGKYRCRSITLGRTSGTLSESGNAAESDIGQIVDDEDLLCVNTREIGKSTHDLSTSTYLPLVFWGMETGDQTTTGLRGVVFDGFQWEDC